MHSQVQNMIDEGFIKQGDEGSLVPVLNPAESEYLKSEMSKKKAKLTMTPDEVDQLNANIDKLNARSGDADMQ